MRVLVSVSTALALLSAPAFAASSPKDPEDKRICKRTEEGHTGTRLAGSTKICRKASEWRLLEEETQRDLRAVQDRAGVQTASGSPADGPSPN
jgi:hypothetical protein